MHQVSEFGIAAHWKYKEGGSPAAGGDTERFNWLRQLVDWQQEGGSDDHNDYLASIKEDLFDEEVFVFTPKGDVLGLRKGSTAVDFAYRIHSEVGNLCHGVRINDRLCPLSTPLQNGDFINILTSKTPTPASIGSTSWPRQRLGIASASGTSAAIAMKRFSAARSCWSGSWGATVLMHCSTAKR